MKCEHAVLYVSLLLSAKSLPDSSGDMKQINET